MKIFSTKGHKDKSILRNLAVLGGWIFLWWLISRGVGKEYLVPSPFKVAQRLVQLGGDGTFWARAFLSSVRILGGFLLALGVGFLLGSLCYFIPLLHTAFRPILSMVTAVPVVSFIILAIVWLPSGGIPSFITFLMVTPLVWNNVYKGLESTPKELLEMTFVYNVSFKKRWKGLYFPSVLPYFSAAVVTGSGFGWKAGIAAEVLALPLQSIGEEIYGAKVYLETTDLFAWTLVVVALSFLSEKLFVGLLQRFFPTMKGDAANGADD